MGVGGRASRGMRILFYRGIELYFNPKARGITSYFNPGSEIKDHATAWLDCPMKEKILPRGFLVAADLATARKLFFIMKLSCRQGNLFRSGSPAPLYNVVHRCTTFARLRRPPFFVREVGPRGRS